MEYLDFEILVDDPSDGRYPVEVLRSPAGEARSTATFPFQREELAGVLRDMETVFRSGVGAQPQPAGTSFDPRSFGAALFEALFPGPLRSRFIVSREKAAASGMGLRIKLRIRPPELAALPWEFLFDPDQSTFLSLSRATPLVRYVEAAQPIQALAVRPPFRILGVAANPSDMPALDVARERRRVESGLADLIEKGQVELHWVEGETWRDLRAAIWQGPWHILHFVGHGGLDPKSGAGVVVFSDEDGRAHRLPAESLALLLNDHDPLRLVLLNSCEGARAGSTGSFASAAESLIRTGLPAVLAMQYEITDEAAIEFARTFYEAIAAGMPVDSAVAEARRAIRVTLGDTPEWATPVLHMRSGDGRLFVVESTASTPTPSEAAEARGPAATDDPAESVSPPVAVEPAERTLTVELARATPTAARAKTVTYRATVRNAGASDAAVRIATSVTGGVVSGLPERISLPAGRSEEFEVAVTSRGRWMRPLGPTRLTVTASHEGGDGPPAVATAEFRSPPGRRATLIGAGGLAVAGMLAVSGLWALGGNGGDDDDGATDTTTAIVPAGIPDGEVAFTSFRDGMPGIFSVRSDRSNERALTPSGWPASEGAWSPDGKLLAFTSDLDGDYEIWVVEPGSEEVRQLTDDPAEDRDPVWSPDGLTVAFWSTRSDALGDIYAVNVESGRVGPLAVQPGYDEMGGWSPDGRYFTYVSDGIDGTREIFVADADGDNPVQVTFFEATARWPRFSPDSTRIAFASDADGDWEIYAVTSEGDEWWAVTDDEALDVQPAWTPDGNYIVFATDREGGSAACPPEFEPPCADRELYVVAASGSELPRRFYGTPAFEMEPTWRPEATAD